MVLVRPIFLADSYGVFPIVLRVKFKELIHQINCVHVWKLLVNVGDKDCAGDATQVSKLSGVNASSFRPKLYDSQEVSIRCVARHTFMDVRGAR